MRNIETFIFGCLLLFVNLLWFKFKITFSYTVREKWLEIPVVIQTPNFDLLQVNHAIGFFILPNIKTHPNMVLDAKDIFNFLNIRGTPANMVCQLSDLNLRPFKLKGSGCRFQSLHVPVTAWLPVFSLIKLVLNICIAKRLLKSVARNNSRVDAIITN